MTGKTVTRAELANAVYRLQLLNRRAQPPEPISRDKSAELVEAVLQLISDTLARGETVKLSSFGAFEVREKAARIGRNPKTGEEAEITPRKVLVFRASHILKDRLNAEAETEPSAGRPGASSAPDASSSGATDVA